MKIVNILSTFMLTIVNVQCLWHKTWCSINTFQTHSLLSVSKNALESFWCERCMFMLKIQAVLKAATLNIKKSLIYKP